MNVYLLILNFCMDSITDTNVEVYATKQAAQKAMREQFEATKIEYAETIKDYEMGELTADACVVLEPNDTEASMEIPDDYLYYTQKYDQWLIVEKEVQGAELSKDLLLLAEKYTKAYDATDPSEDGYTTDEQLIEIGKDLALEVKKQHK